MPARECSRTACSRPAVSTLTYVYEDSTAVLGPLSRSSEPHAYDLCADHGQRLTAPRGWRLIHVPGGAGASDDLVALADAVRGGEQPDPEPAPAPAGAAPRPGERHLQVVRSSGHE
nr:DUF3499 domain-containing protein [Brachybacterium phenoliresistens]